MRIVYPQRGETSPELGNAGPVKGKPRPTRGRLSPTRSEAPPESMDVETALRPCDGDRLSRPVRARSGLGFPSWTWPGALLEKSGLLDLKQ